MITSKAGIDLIKDFEGVRLTAYLCSAGKWTIGYGHTAEVKRGDRITAEQAERFLKGDLITVENDINRLVRVPINQNQFDALASFVFNFGARKFSTSTLLRKLNAKDYSGAAGEFSRWVYVDGKKLSGLERRRLMERRLFES